MARNTLIRAATFEDATRYWLWYNGLIIAITIFGIPLLLIVLPLVYLAKSIEYKHLSCELHERSVKIKRGWLNKREQTIPLDKITDLGIQQNFLMRKFDVEGITIETAGQSAGATALVMLVGMRDARGFRDAVIDQRDKLAYGDDSDAPATAMPRAAAPLDSPAALISPGNAELTEILRDIRADLRAIRKGMDDRG